MTKMGLGGAEGTGHRDPKPWGSRLAGILFCPVAPHTSVLLHPHLQRAIGGWILANSKAPATHCLEAPHSVLWSPSSRVGCAAWWT